MSNVLREILMVLGFIFGAVLVITVIAYPVVLGVAKLECSAYSDNGWETRLSYKNASCFVKHNGIYVPSSRIQVSDTSVTIKQ